jgi:hypothetical protein
MMVEKGRRHTGRESMFSKSTGLKVPVRTMSWFRDTTSFDICPAVLILHIRKQILEDLSREAAC